MQDTNRKVVAKWGFGMAPISDRMRSRYDAAVRDISLLVKGELSIQDLNVEQLSELKGMFNRCVRQDQWDWFSVYSELGRPPSSQLRRLIQDLVGLRRACQESDRISASAIIGRSIKGGIVRILESYKKKTVQPRPNGNTGWLYLLSTKDRPDIIKIGMTQRPVEERVKEINSATGVLIPLSARRVYAVKETYLAEKRVHERLARFRIRPDREFFQIAFPEAVAIVEQCLVENVLLERSRGTLVWLDRGRGYGFLESPEIGAVFLHLSEVNPDQVDAMGEGALLEYSLSVGSKGLAAQRASIISGDHALEGSVGVAGNVPFALSQSKGAAVSGPSTQHKR